MAVLRQTLSPHQASLDQAAQWLEAGLASQPTALLSCLLAVLLEQGLEPGVRQQAGLQLRHLLQWPGLQASLGVEARQETRRCLLEALAKEAWRPSVASLCVLALARQEHWPGLLAYLAARLASSAGKLEVLACLDTLVCVMPELDHGAEEVAQVLTAVVTVCREGPSGVVRAAGYRALQACLPQVTCHMARRGERDYLLQVVLLVLQVLALQVVCEATQGQEEEEAEAALACLVHLACLYWPLMEVIGPCEP